MAEAAVGGVRKTDTARPPRLSFTSKKYLTYGVIVIMGILVVLVFQFDLSFMREWLPYIARGTWFTLILCFGGIALAIPLALLGALGRLSRSGVLNGIANFYTSFFRGTPLLVQIYFIYFAFPQLAFKPGVPDFLEPFLVYDVIFAGILALGLNYGAYMTEIFRGGIQSIGHGQVEAAHALGMSAGQTMRRVVLPQAVRVIIPPTGNDFIAMLKDSSLVGVVGTVQELFNRAQVVGKAESRAFETLAIAALIYWFLTGVFSFFQGKLEKRYARGHVREEAHDG
ncbi:MAG TPA: amino acid ABC transporter permease [Actinomycetota bacterium]|nr:amino acid ABC transporter permease [Actinomycetota bacterium]